MTRFITLFAVAFLFASSTGCWSNVSRWKFSNMLDLDKGMPWEKDEEELPAGTPARMVSSWVDTVKHTQGQMSQRGFGGRIIFYDDKSNDPIRVEGELIVYAFDEADRDPIDNRPTRRFVFPAEQIELHMSKSTIGPSYSFFLPWDEVGGPQTEISLICRFKPKLGAVVVSEQTRLLLPGAIPAGALADGKARSRATAPTDQPKYQKMVYESRGGKDQVEQVGYQAPGSGTSSRQMTTTAIPLPANYQLPGDSGRSQQQPDPPRREVRPPSRHEYYSYRPLPAFEGQSAASLPSTRQAAAFSAQFQRPPRNPATINATTGPQMLSPFGPLGPQFDPPARNVTQNAQYMADILAPPVHNLAQPAQNPPGVANALYPFGQAPSYLDHASSQTPAGQQIGMRQLPPAPAVTPQFQPTAFPAPAVAPAYAAAGAAPTGASPMGGATKVSYLSPEESRLWERGQRSFDSQSGVPQVPTLPGVR